jgi:Flp pilus assembly protein TadD
MLLAAFISLCVLVLSPVPMGGAQTAQTRAVQHLRAGQEALQNERWEIAEREFKEAIEFDPLLELAHYGLGQTCMATKRYVEAVRAFVGTREAFQRGAADQMVNSLDAERRVEDQIRTLKDQRRALESGRYRTPNLQTTLIRIDDQIRQLEAGRGRKRDGSAPVTPAYISVALGSAYFRTEAFADAEREWRAALQTNPKLGEAHNNLAVVLMLTGRFEEAEREVDLAEKSGHTVSDRFKQDLKVAKAKSKG